MGAELACRRTGEVELWATAADDHSLIRAVVVIIVWRILGIFQDVVRALFLALLANVWPGDGPGGGFG